jgi:phosphoglycerate kinase
MIMSGDMLPELLILLYLWKRRVYKMKKGLNDINFKAKRTLVRVDFNVPLDDGEVRDDTRILAALPTIEYLINEGAKIILISHLGRPEGRVIDSLRMDPVAQKLADLLGKEVTKVDDCIGEESHKAIEDMNEGDIVLLENSRFYSGEESNDPAFARELAELADVFVNDAFGAAHRAHATTVGVTEYLPSVAGFLLQKEIEILSEVMQNPEHPFVAILGGAKVSDKIGVIRNLLDKVDYLLLGGGIANTFLLAKGYEMGKSLVEEDKVELARELLIEADKKGVKLILPIDVVAANDFKEDARHMIVTVDNIPEDWQSLDSGGKETIRTYSNIIKEARTIIWNGPIGVFEMDEFAKGTNAIARAMADSNAKTIIGGGDSAAAIKKAGLEDKMTHISTGGGASLEFFEGKNLPGLEALDNVE